MTSWMTASYVQHRRCSHTRLAVCSMRQISSCRPETRHAHHCFRALRQWRCLYRTFGRYMDRPNWPGSDIWHLDECTLCIQYPLERRIYSGLSAACTPDSCARLSWSSFAASRVCPSGLPLLSENVARIRQQQDDPSEGLECIDRQC